MDLLKISWHDAQDLKEMTWASKQEADAFASTPCLIESVGWLVKKTRAYITIAGDFSPNPDTYGRVEKIPRKMVVKIEGLTPSLCEPAPSTTPIAVEHSASAPVKGEKP